MRTGIVGGSGYAGGELLRLLLSHPDAEITAVTSRRFAGEYVHMIHPNLREVSRIKFTEPDLSELGDKCDVVFLATPHGVSKDLVPELVSQGIKIVDLSADFRLRDETMYPQWYGWEHPHPDLLESSVYGLPELHRGDIREAEMVACPGCMACASLLALAPIVKAGYIDTGRIVVDAKIGSSGGGSEPTLASHHPERFGAVRPYQTVGHRHTAEIEQELNLLNTDGVKVAFSPHAVNSARGILVTCHLWYNDALSDRDIWRTYRGFYDDEPFIRMVKYRKGLYRLPDPKVVVGTNYCDIGFEIDDHVERVVLISAIDNIVRGASGQAVQCMNIMYGLDERSGLYAIGIH